MQPLISIIVPVFNAEKYIEECIESILAQTWETFELLLVDDGSTDESPCLCERFQKQDARVRLFRQENRGVSAARNRGIQQAQGEYFAFVDADDVLHPCYLESLLRGIRFGEGCLSVCTFQRFPANTKPVFADARENFQNISRLEALRRLNECHTVTSLEMVCPWNKLYAKELFRELRFREGVRHEDEFLAHELLMECDEVTLSGAPLYFFRENAESFMGKTEDQQSLKHLILFDALTERIDFLAQREPSQVTAALHHLLRECSAFYDTYRKSSNAAYRKKLPWLMETYKASYKSYYKKISAGEKWKGGIFIACPALYLALGKIKKKVRKRK